MYMLFRDVPSRRLGQTVAPGFVYIRQTYRSLISDVKRYYSKAPKYVDSRNLFALLIQQFVINMSVDDDQWIRDVERITPGVVRNLELVSPINKGKVYMTGITLGPHSEEVAIASYEKFNRSDLGNRWRELTPVKYLYHTRTDTSLPIMNNTTPGKAHGVITVNIPMLMVQYRYWLQWQKRLGVEQFENVYRFIGSVVLPNMLDSFLDIAFFNRIDRDSQNIPNPTFPTQHPFYLTNLNDRLDKLAKTINFESTLKGIEIEGLAWITPMIIKPNLFDVMELPREPITYQNEWAISLARLPYVRYLCRMVMRNHGYDRSQINEILIDLIEASRDQIFNNLGSSEFAKSFRKNIEQLITDIKK